MPFARPTPMYYVLMYYDQRPVCRRRGPALASGFVTWVVSVAFTAEQGLGSCVAKMIL